MQLAALPWQAARLPRRRVKKYHCRIAQTFRHSSIPNIWCMPIVFQESLGVGPSLFARLPLKRPRRPHWGLPLQVRRACMKCSTKEFVISSSGQEALYCRGVVPFALLRISRIYATRCLHLWMSTCFVGPGLAGGRANSQKLLRHFACTRSTVKPLSFMEIVRLACVIRL